MSDSALKAVLARLAADRVGAEARLFDLLRIPSISAQSEHKGDCVRAGQSLCDRLTALGFTARLVPTKGHPVVLAHHDRAGPGAPHLLYYGHYDVQPPEPLELWHSPPFEPVVVEGPHGKRVVARGAVDDKGQLSMWIEAFAAWVAQTGGLPVRVTAIIEGEEEIGSPSLDGFLADYSAELAADAAVISDTNMWDVATPAITTRLRGMVYSQIDITAANRDLHSGLFGGSALNPITLLARILGDLHDSQGRVQLPGFYDNVIPPAAAESATWQALGFDEAASLAQIGLATPAGEAGLGALERLWARPTAEPNGIWGGYTGEGAKTVIASHAHAKVSFRLVPGQDPAAIQESLRSFVAARLPPEVTFELTFFSSSPGFAMDIDSPLMEAAKRALKAQFGKDTVFVGCGGSIPVVGSFKRILELDSLLMGFGLEDDHIHSPNEKFELCCFHNGTAAHARLLGELAKR
jgi:acetylornithine deacetylase/succinyl-diaminopimelate desuccinylase-like protein